MFGFATSLLSGAIDPLIDKASAFGATLLRKVALFLVAALCMVVVVIALTMAFFMWLATRANPIVAALAVAGLYLAIAIVAIVLALRGGSKKPVAADAAEIPAAAETRQADTQIDQFLAPLLALLSQFGLKREQLAVFAGATLAKRLGPVPMVALALIGGFLVGRMWKTWRTLFATDAIASLLSSGLFGAAPKVEPEDV